VKKFLRLIAVLAVACCLLSICALSSAAADNGTYYYKVRCITKLNGDDLQNKAQIYYSLHGYSVNGQSNPLLPCNADGSPSSSTVKAHMMELQPGERTKDAYVVFSCSEPLVGVRLLQEEPSVNGLLGDEVHYYLELDLAKQQPGIENAVAIEKMPSIEGFAPGGAIILSPEKTECAFTLTYDAPPVFSGVDPEGTYVVTQQLTVYDPTLAGVTLNGESVPFEGDTAVVNLPGNTDIVYQVSAWDENGSQSKLEIRMQDFNILFDPVSGLSPDKVQGENEADIQEVLNIVLGSMQEPHITQSELDELRAMETELRELLAQIDEAEACRNSENILNTQHITAENVELEDRNALLAAAIDLERALQDYSGNYSSDTLEMIEYNLERVLAALEVVEEYIASLPKTGDDSALKLWCVLLTASASGILLVFRRRHAAG